MLSGSLTRLSLLAFMAINSINAANVTLNADSASGVAMIKDPVYPDEMTPAPHDIYYKEKCFCEQNRSWPLKTPESGAYVRVQYFNHIHQIWFSLEWICKLDIGVHLEKDGECTPKFEGVENEWSKWSTHKDSRHFSDYVTNEYTGFEWGYYASLDIRQEDVSWFGKSIRKIGYHGESLLDSQEDVLEFCDRRCKERVDPGLTAFKPWAKERTLKENAVDWFGDESDDDWCEVLVTDQGYTDCTPQHN